MTGASDGIGRAFALQLAAEGLDVALVARRDAALAELAAEISALHPQVQTLVIRADLSECEGLSALIERTEALDVGLLVAAAGYGTSGPFLDGELSQELGMIDVNCRAVAELAHVFGRRLVRRGRGGLILMSSLLAFQGVPLAANYAASKAYIQSLAEGLRVELAPKGVDVLSCAPGPVHSGFAARAGMRMSLAVAPAAVASATLRALGRRGTVRAGWLSKLLEASLSLLPRWGRSLVLARVMSDMTRHRTS